MKFPKCILGHRFRLSADRLGLCKFCPSEPDEIRRCIKCGDEHHRHGDTWDANPALHGRNA